MYLVVSFNALFKYTYSRLLFHTTTDVHGVYKSRLDGSEIMNIVSTDIREPTAVDFDYNNGRICWSAFCKCQ